MNETNATVDFSHLPPFFITRTYTPCSRLVSMSDHVCWVSLLCCHVPCFRFPRLIDRGIVPIPKSTKFEPVKMSSLDEESIEDRSDAAPEAASEAVVVDGGVASQDKG